MDKKSQMDSSVELKELVYAPLEAISEANIRLSSNIVNFISSTGDVNTDSSGKKVIQLRTIQMMYEQLRSDELNSTVADSIGLEIPLLSIYPLSSLKISKTKVAFDAEIKTMKATDEGIRIFTQVCSSKQRAGAIIPRISYEVEMDSAPVPEGLARFIDTLNTQAIPKLIHSKPVDNSGKKLSGKELEEYEKLRDFKQKESTLFTKLSEVKEMIRAKSNALKLETGMSFDEYSEQMDNQKEPSNTTPPESYTAIKQYQAISNDLESQLNSLRSEIIINNVIGDAPAEEPFVLEKNNE